MIRAIGSVVGLRFGFGVVGVGVGVGVVLAACGCGSSRTNDNAPTTATVQPAVQPVTPASSRSSARAGTSTEAGAAPASSSPASSSPSPASPSGFGAEPELKICGCSLCEPVISDDPCNADADCAPATPCHATRCVARAKAAPRPSGQMCTMMMACNSVDANKCGCFEGRCALTPRK